MKTSVYIPDSLHAELKQRNADISQITRAALESWVSRNGPPEMTPAIALRYIDLGTQYLRDFVVADWEQES